MMTALFLGGSSQKVGAFMQLQNASSTMQGDGGVPWWTALPFDLRDVRISRGSRPVGFRFSQFIINVEAELNGAKISACGEANTEDLAMTKALMELVERVSLAQRPFKRTKTAPRTSNGWAAHETLPQAKNHAVFELVERDAVLAQWYLSSPFLELSPEDWPVEIVKWAQDELALSEFPRMRLLLSTEGLGPSLTCLFVNDRGRGVSGHATKATLSESIEAAIAETCRAAHHALRRSFWEDAQKLRNRTPGIRVQPGAHAVFYAYYGPFPAWMLGDCLSWADAERMWSLRTDLLRSNELSEFDFQQTLDEPAVVGFATHPLALELTWGTTDLQTVLKRIEGRKFSVSIQKRILNTQPHIIS
ncbi:MAG: YcaO-like family protein [Bacteriovoracia bacterium]